VRVRTSLVVDDSRVIRKVARRILEGMGFEVAEASDGQEALNWCQSTMPDAILLDWNMPVLNGLDFVRQLRQQPGGQGPVVVFCTVENDKEHVVAALDAGANEYVMKPFDGDVIRAKFTAAGLI
jgi:two-component system chemotaxis response regulator CheY